VTEVKTAKEEAVDVYYEPWAFENFEELVELEVSA
jgi:hypothetical protein